MERNCRYLRARMQKTNESLEQAKIDSRPDLVHLWSRLLEKMRHEMPPKPMSVNLNDQWKYRDT